jgi:hypothetical protein
MSVKEEEEDPIVDTIEIFNSSSLANQSMLLQFPLVSRSTVPSVQMVAKSIDDDSYSFTFLRTHDPFTSSDSDRYLVRVRPVTITQPLALGVLRGNQLHLTPIHEVYQGRPTQLAGPVKTGQDAPGIPVDWFDLEANSDRLVARSGDELAAAMSATLFQSKLSDTKSDLSPALLEGMTEESLEKRSPREQLYLRLQKDKTIQFHDVLEQLRLKAHANELLETLLQFAYFVQGRWTIRPECLPESVLPSELRLARAFFIVLFAHEKTLPQEVMQGAIDRLGISKGQLRQVMDSLGLLSSQASQAGGSGRTLMFKWRKSTLFERDFKDCVAKAKVEIGKLKESVCLGKGDPTIFDQWIQ